MPSPGDVIRIARLFLYVREAQSIGQNRGLRVEAIQHWAGGAFGDSWCAEFVWIVLDIFFAGHPPFDRMQSCEAIRAMAQDRGWITSTPSIGDLFLYINAAGRAHHAGFVTALAPLTGIAGNTSPDGSSPNGDGVYEHAISAKVFVHYFDFEPVPVTKEATR